MIIELVKIDVSTLSRSGIPEIEIHFANGFTDELILERYFPNEESKLDREYQESCNYFGHLKKEGVCVAATGCYGKEDMDFTIPSRQS